jgi:Uma2 family endonuclease
MFVSSSKDQNATLADLLAIPEGLRRHEIIDGVLLEKEAATGRHGGAQGRLFRRLGPYDRKPGGRSPGGWWFATEVEVLLAEQQIYRPDIGGWRRERLDILPTTWPVTVRPDWVCEVLSTNRRRDLIQKKRGYHRTGVPHYWVVDPEEEMVSVYRWHADGYIEVLGATREERVRAEPFEAIEFRVGMLFGDDDDDDQP